MLPTSPVTLLATESCVAASHAGGLRSASSGSGLCSSGIRDRFSGLIYTIPLRGGIASQYYAPLGAIVTKTGGHLAQAMLAAVLLAALSALAQQPPSPGQDGSAGGSGQAAGQQALDLQDLVARDVLEPLRDGVQTHNLKQVLAVFDGQSFPDFPQLRDQIKAFLDSYSVLQFRYKILQASSEQDSASVICEVDMDATPLDEGQVPRRRSTQLRLQLKQTPKAWQISAFSPSDFFAL